MSQTQKVYLGSHLIERTYLGSDLIAVSGAFKQWPDDIVRDGLVAYFNSTEGADASEWKASYGDYTGSYVTAGVTYNATEQVIDFNGAQPSLQFGNPPITGNPPPEHTILIFTKPKQVTSRQVMEFQGGVGGGRKATYLELAQSGSDAVFSYLNSDLYRYTAYEFGAIPLNEWHLFGYGFSGSAQTDVDLYVDNQTTPVTGSGTTVNIENITQAWEMGVVSATGPFSGSAAAMILYDRKLTDSEVLQNYEYLYKNIAL